MILSTSSSTNPLVRLGVTSGEDSRLQHAAWTRGGGLVMVHSNDIYLQQVRADPAAHVTRDTCS